MTALEPQQGPQHLPSRVIFELIEQCNYRCIHCFVPHRARGPATDVAAVIAEKIAAEGVPSISWTGGEPFLRSDLIDLAAIGRGRTVQTVNTNGSLITSMLARQCAQVFALARVSIFGTPSTVKAHTDHRPATYQTPFDAIRMFLNAGLRVQVNVPVIGDLDELTHITGDLKALFGAAIEELVVIPVIKVGPVENSTRAYAAGKPIAEHMARLSDSVPFPVRIFTWKPGKHMLIKADTKAYAHPIEAAPDGVRYIGDPLTESIAAIWARFPPEFVHAHRDLTPSVDHLITG